MVRRIKPLEEPPAETATHESIVYVPADDDTVYIQAENVEETETRIAEENTAENREKEQKTLEKDDEIVLPNRSSGSFKYGVSLYNYSKTKTKSTVYAKDIDNRKSPKGQGASNIYTGGSSRSPQSGFSRDQYNPKYYHEFAKQDRGFYPESGAHGGRYYGGNHEPYQKYRKSKYYDEAPPTFYPPNSSSHRSSKGHINSRSADRHKTDAYLSYDKYRTMANLPGEEQDNQSESASSKKSTNENIMVKTFKKGTLVNTETNNEGTKSNNKNTIESKTNQPPQLVFVVSQSEGAENTSTFDKSPPALEKCESSYAEDDLLKVEDEESQDSVNGAEETKDDPNQTQEAVETPQSPTTNKFV